MRQNNLRRHTTKHEAHGDAKQHQMVIHQDTRILASDPCDTRRGKRSNSHKLTSNLPHRQAAGSLHLNNIVDAERKVDKQESAAHDDDPEIIESRGGREDGGEEGEMGGERGRVDFGSVDAGKEHEKTPENEAFGRTVDRAKVENVGVVGFPGGEKHGEGREEGSEGADRGCTEAEGGGLTEGGKGAVEGVDAMAGRF